MLWKPWEQVIDPAVQTKCCCSIHNFFYDSKKIPLISPLLINYKFVADIKTKQTYLKNPSPKNVLFWKTIVFFQQVKSPNTIKTALDQL